jgi:hypothetical protein
MAGAGRAREPVAAADRSGIRRRERAGAGA